MYKKYFNSFKCVYPAISVSYCLKKCNKRKEDLLKLLKTVFNDIKRIFAYILFGIYMSHHEAKRRLSCSRDLIRYLCSLV